MWNQNNNWSIQRDLDAPFFMLIFKLGEGKMRYDAKMQRWTPMEIRGVRGYFNDLRIDRSTVPSGFHFWELADGDSDGTPCRYKPGLLVNFYGTFITAGELPIDCPECQEGFISSDEEWGYMDCSYYSLAEIVEMECGNAESKSKEKGSGRNEDTEIQRCP